VRSRTRPLGEPGHPSFVNAANVAPVIEEFLAEADAADVR
jgi:hypothetical protein